jgi:hypothetical protein
MRIRDLSDHVGDLTREAEARLGEARDVTDQARQFVRTAERAYRSARWGPEMWRRVLFLPSPAQEHAERTLELEDRRFFRTLAVEQRAYDEVEQLTAGQQGEQILTDALAPELDDDWILYTGYRNQRGETDGLLVGPSGMWGVEVKHYRARLHVDGERWWYERLDANGSVVATGDAADTGGRSWGRQARDVADSLEGWLRQNEIPNRIRTVVYITHPRGWVGTVRHPCVDLVIDHQRALLDDIAASDRYLEAELRERIEALVERDHAHHNPPR